MNIPENTTTRIPASAWHTIFYDHFDGIRLSDFYKISDIQIKITISIRTFSGKCIVYIDKYILVYRFEFQPDAFVFCLFFKLQRRLIHHIFLVEKSVARTVWFLWIPQNLHQMTDRKITRADLEAHFNYSGDTLYKTIKNFTGLSIHDYSSYICMKKAADLLISSDENINDIAESVGFRNFTQFYREFKKFYHVTPREYRLAYASYRQKDS